MIVVNVGELNYSDYLSMYIWTLENTGELRMVLTKYYNVIFEDAEDATAFKLIFGI